MIEILIAILLIIGMIVALYFKKIKADFVIRVLTRPFEKIIKAGKFTEVNKNINEENLEMKISDGKKLGKIIVNIKLLPLTKILSWINSEFSNQNWEDQKKEISLELERHGYRILTSREFISLCAKGRQKKMIKIISLSGTIVSVTKRIFVPYFYFKPEPRSKCLWYRGLDECVEEEDVLVAVVPKKTDDCKNTIHWHLHHSCIQINKAPISGAFLFMVI